MPAGAAGRELLAYELLAGRLEAAEGTAFAGAGRAGAAAPARESFQHLFDSEILRLVAGYRVWSEELCSAVEAQKEALRALEDRLAGSGALGGAHPDAEDPREGRGGGAPSPPDWQVLGGEAQRWRDLAAELTSLLEWVTVNLHGVSNIMLMYSRGPLAPLDPDEEHTMFEFHHPNLPSGKIQQHTFMNEEAAREIQAMGRKIHPRLVAAGTVIRSALYRLHSVRKGLCASSHASYPVAPASGASETPSSPSWPSVRRVVQQANLRHLYGVLRSVDAEIRRFDRRERSLLNEGNLGNSLSFRSASVLDSLERAEEAAGEDLAFELHSHSFPARAGIFQPPPPDYKAFATTSGLLINLASTFLYMAAYSVILPPGPDYLSHLSVSESFLGAVVGATDLSAILASFLYGAWTSSSYRLPLLFSSFACSVGCLLCVLAWNSSGTQGLLCLLAGRFIVGFGCFRSANRRYIADFVSRRGRTAASSAFVAASSAGAAAGPLFATVVTRTKPANIAGVFPWNGATGGLFLISGFWNVFLNVAWLVFEDPLRRSPPMGLAKGEDIFAGEEGVAEAPESDEEDLTDSPQASPSGGLSSSGQNTPLLPRRRTSRSLRPLLVCMGGLFVLKMNQQALLSVLPLLCDDFFKWSDTVIGLFISCLSVGMLTVNAGLAFVSKYISDLPILACSQVCLLLGVLALFPFAVRTPLPAFVAGSIVVYASTVVMEAVAMSILSKIISEKLRQGTFNAGVIASLSGSLGRFVGNLGITALGMLFAKDGATGLARALFAVMSSAAALSLAQLALGFGDVHAALRRLDSG